MLDREFVKRSVWLAGAALLAFTATSCSSGPEAPIALAPRLPYWQAYSANPVVKAGDLRDKGLWNDPCVIMSGDTYVMFMSTSTKEPFKPPILPFRAVSKNGIDWRLDPEQPLVDASGTPFDSIETPSVVLFKGTYHMYYSGIHPPGHVPMMEIGHATSPDGIHWTKDPKPVIASSGKPAEWSGFLVGEPGAIVYKGRVYVYFTGLGARPSGSPPQLQSIGLAISDDGVNFDKPRVVLRQTKLYPAEQGFPGYSTPAALVDGDTIHLFYDVVHFDSKANPQWRQVALQHAVSTDGGLTFVESAGPLLRRDDNDWTAQGELDGPTAIIDGDQVKVWFGGHAGYATLGDMIRRGFKGREFGIGLVTTPLANLRAPPQ